jgi:hypothetical protein
VRSEMVFAAEQKLANRYMLCRVLATAIRKMHKPTARIEDTTNSVLEHIRTQRRTAEPSTGAGGNASNCLWWKGNDKECYATNCT